MDLILILLLAAVLCVPITQRLGLGAIPGYLIAGVLVGPSCLKLVTNVDTMIGVSQWGVVMMLFIIGLELSPRRLWAMRNEVFVLGSLQMLFCGLLLGVVFGAALRHLAGMSWQAAVLCGLSLALSSTAVALRLFPKPRSTGVAFVGLASARAALDLFVFLRDRADRDLTAFEYLPPFALDLALRHGQGTVRPLAGDHGAYALIEFSSCRPGSEARHDLEAALGEALEAGMIEDAAIASGGAQANALWDLREAVPEAQTREGGSIKHDVSVPLARLPEFLERANAACLAAMPGLRPCGFGHFGDGNIHFNLSQPVGMDKAEFLSHWTRFNRIVHDVVHELGGSIAAEHGVGLIKREELARYAPPVALDLMRDIKSALDPRGLLSPGKVIPAQDARP